MNGIAMCLQINRWEQKCRMHAQLYAQLHFRHINDLEVCRGGIMKHGWGLNKKAFTKKGREWFHPDILGLYITLVASCMLLT